ncbi:hypothetical protein PM082_000314 [Marasmius tenuissimus]|nr:hypothetical protein PM082_000314 [Marasmius tenuissimus]
MFWKLFPAANYAYKIVGVLCKAGFIIPRHKVDESSDLPVEEVHNEDTNYEVTIKRFPIPLPCPMMCVSEGSAGSLNKDTKPHVLLKVRSINPTKYDEDKVFWLWQDPFFVLINVGELIHTLRKRWEAKNTAPFSLGSFITEKKHCLLLWQAFKIYKSILDVPAPHDPI